MVLNISSFFITIIHLCGLYGLCTVSPSLFDLSIFSSMVTFTGFGITMGYHRLWSHHSYNASTPLQYILAFAGSGAIQGSILWWSRLHRLHHNKTDTVHDPYNAQLGFLYSHMGWLFENKYNTQLHHVNVHDLKKDPIVMFQHRNYIAMFVSCAMGVPFLLYSIYGKPYINGFYFAFIWARIFTWHSTWFINSLAHWLGTQDNGTSNSSRNNIITAFLTFGEGYHNYHHEFPYDYKNGNKWYHYDPTKILIYMCSWVGITYSLQSRESLSNYVNMHLPVKLDNMTLTEYLYSKNNLIVYHNNIYDITHFIPVHPGGVAFMKNIIRKDPQYIEDMFSKHNNHTQNALVLLNKHKVCELIECSTFNEFTK